MAFVRIGREYELNLTTEYKKFGLRILEMAMLSGWHVLFQESGIDRILGKRKDSPYRKPWLSRFPERLKSKISGAY